ncbi:MAG: hypothetical protein U1B79_00320, partial [Candidatus Pacearchaeota archaeon]|nr:hypothetical protein [Candidatus Pacearchaeota archaeon]
MKKKRFEFKYYKEVFAVAAVIFGILALYYTFIPEECGNFECFQTEMKKCSPAKYINEESEASWEYWIRGVEGNKCAVKVTLLGAKEGDLG